MKHPVRRISAILAVTLLALSATACGKSDDGGSASGDAASGSKGALKTGPGVTATTIRLGVLTDMSGPFAGQGLPLVNGNRLFWKLQNENGGVCGREVTLTVKNHGYDPQKAVTLYREIEPDVLALQQLLGSAVGAALLPSIQQDGMLAVTASWSSALTANANMLITATTYDVEAITGIKHLVDEGVLHRGDKLGQVYFEGEFGENALKGAKYAAAEYGLTIAEQKIKPTETDLSAQVASLKQAGVSAILISAGPTQTASLAGLAAAGGLDVPIISNSPGFDPALLATPAAKAIEKNLTVFAGTAPYSLPEPAVQEMASAYRAEHPKETPKLAVTLGYVEAKLAYEVLKRACDANDLTREGTVKALRQLTDVDTGGLVAGTLDYSRLGVPPSRAVYQLRVDPDVPGGLAAVGPERVVPDAEAYDPTAG